VRLEALAFRIPPCNNPPPRSYVYVDKIGSMESTLNLRVIGLFLGLSLGSSCDLQRLAVDQTAEILYAGRSALEGEEDVQFAEASIPASLKTIETFLVSAPDDAHLLELLAKGYFSYSYGFVEWKLEKGQYSYAEEAELEELSRRAVAFYLRSRDFGFRLLDKPDLQKAAIANDEKKLASALKNVEKEDVPGLFWAAYGWASAINLSQDDSDMVASLPTIEAIMKRIQALDDNYFYSGVHYFLGVYHASKPKMFGGDPDKAKEHFDIAMKRHGDQNLMIPYLYARFYAPAVQDKELYQTMLKKVLETQVDDPSLRLNNAVARERAKFWIEHADELIFE
jgi:hypothetical protein